MDQEDLKGWPNAGTLATVTTHFHDSGAIGPRQQTEKAAMEGISNFWIDKSKSTSRLHRAQAKGSVASRSMQGQVMTLTFPVPQSSCAVALALLMLVIATNAPVQARERVWTVTCGLPQQDNPILELMPTGGYTGPWFGDPYSGHLEVKTLNRPHPEGSISTEMWLLSRSVGWWRLKAIRVHPDDHSKLNTEAAWQHALKKEPIRGARQIIDSPFLSRPAVVRSGNTKDEELVDGQILALLPDASQLRCASWSNGTDAVRVAAVQRALTNLGYNPGPIDGRMGPLTRAALRVFQAEHGLTPHGQLDDATLERLR